MDMKQLDKMLTDKACEYGTVANWFAEMHTPSLSELYRYGQHAVHEVIDNVRSECKTLDDVDELLDEMRYTALNNYKFLQSEHFDHLAELEVFAHGVFGEIISDIERNK